MPTVSDHLARWQAAHTAAQQARRTGDLGLSLAKVVEAQAALADAGTLDLAATNAALPQGVTLASLSAFYASQLAPDRAIAPKFLATDEVAEQTALSDLVKADELVKSRDGIRTPGTPAPVTP